MCIIKIKCYDLYIHWYELCTNTRFVDYLYNVCWKYIPSRTFCIKYINLVQTIFCLYAGHIKWLVFCTSEMKDEFTLFCFVFINVNISVGKCDMACTIITWQLRCYMPFSWDIFNISARALKMHWLFAQVMSLSWRNVCSLSILSLF